MSDIIDHPPHYEACRVSIEPIDVCEAYDFCTGNAIKYMCRAGKKAGSSEVTDLKKARWYLERALASKTLRIADRLPLADTPEGMRVRGAILLLCSSAPRCHFSRRSSISASRRSSSRSQHASTT